MAGSFKGISEGKAALCWFADMGLTARLTPDGERFTLTGLGALDTDMHDVVSQRARGQRESILAVLREEAARDLRIEISPPELWPLVCHYTSPASIGHVLAAHGLELEKVGDDFRLKNLNRLAWGLLPKLCFFFRHNSDLINEWLRG